MLCWWVTAIAAEEENEPLPVFADIVASQGSVGAAATATLLVQNDAPVNVRLASCNESVTVPAGGSVSLTLAGVSEFWLLPEGLQFDCNEGPFDLFFVGANLTDHEHVVGIAFGVGMEDGSRVGEDGRVEGSEESVKKNVSGDANDVTAEMNRTIGGVELTVKTVNGTVSARCREGLCTESQQVPIRPDQFVLRVIAPHAGLRSFWHHHHYHHHHYHHHHHRYHHPWHYRHHWHQRYGPGYGPGWYR